MADYSTTMGILQPQVGKSEDILLKFEQKKWRLENFIFPRHSEPLFEAKNSEFRCEIKF